MTKKTKSKKVTSKKKPAAKKSAPKKKVAQALKRASKAAIKKATKKDTKKSTKKSTKKGTKKVAPSASAKKSSKKSSNLMLDSLIELIRVTSTVVPDDVNRVVLKALEKEEKNTTAEYALNIIKANIELAKKKSQPLCQDTGTVLFYINAPVGMDQIKLTEQIHKAINVSTELGYLRQNSVNSLTGANNGSNVGPGHPAIHFHQHKSKDVEIRLVLKGGGCENVSAQYSLPDVGLEAGRDLKGVRKVILDAIVKAQGKGCGPGVLGVCIGGDRAHSHAHAKEQLLRDLDDHSKIKELAEMEDDIVRTANELGIGPMGFGGKTTLLGCKIDHLNRLPASFFVSIAYMCWAYRRQGVKMSSNGKIKGWLY